MTEEVRDAFLAEPRIGILSTPFSQTGTVDISPASSCEKVVERGEC